MTKLKQKIDERRELLELSLGITPGAASLKATKNPTLCAELKIEVDLQRGFMKLYQILLAVLASAILLLLLFGIFRVAKGETIDALLGGAGAIVSGTASAFIKKRLDDARVAYRAAIEAFAKNNC